MRRIAGLIAVSSTLIGVASPAQARDEPLRLAPAAPWVMDYADDSCALRRDFGNAETLVYLEMRQFEPGQLGYQFIVASGQLRLAHYSSAQDVAVRFHPDDGATVAGAAFNMEFPNDVKGVTFSTSLMAHQYDLVNQIDGTEERAAAYEALAQTIDLPVREREVTAIEVIEGFRTPVVLETGSLAAPMQAMRTCLDELLTHWGIDAEAHRTLQQRVVPIDQEQWASEIANGYPPGMGWRGAQAVLRIRLDVTTEGRAGGCHMQSRLGNEEFERTACNLLLEHARFTPAIDASGAAITSYHILTVIYTMG